VDANFAIGPIDWRFELDQGITELGAALENFITKKYFQTVLL
jgi:hypothetical protein